MPLNPSEDYRKKNRELARQNTKHSLRIRKLEQEIVGLKEQLIQMSHSNPPMNKIRQVVKATLNEYDQLQSAIRQHSLRFDEHARQGLLAILYYDSSSFKSVEIPKRSSSKEQSPPTRKYRFKKPLDFQPTALESIEESKSLIPVLSPKKL